MSKSTVGSKLPCMATLDFEQGHLDVTFLRPKRMSNRQLEQHLSAAVQVMLDEKQLAVYGIDVVAQGYDAEYEGGPTVPDIVSICIDQIEDAHEHQELVGEELSDHVRKIPARFSPHCDDGTLAITR